MRSLSFLLILTSVGCGGRPANTKLSGEATPTDAKLDACDFKAIDGELEAQCGTLVVPELRGGNATTLRLPVQHVRAMSGTSGTPIIYIGDGPGASAYQIRPPVALLKDHDFVIVGARGVDGPRTLDCPEVGKALAAGAALTDAWIKEVTSQLDHCVDRFVSDNVQLAGYGVRERAADIESARELFGFSKVSILADGFGATVAEAYAANYPEHVDRMVFLGPTPSTQPVGSRADAELALKQFSGECSAIEACDAMGSDFEALVRETPVPERWLMYRVDTGRLRLATALHLGYRQSAFVELGAWQDAARGDAAGLGQVSWGTDIVFTSGFVWGTALLELASLTRDVPPLAEGGPRSLPSATTIAAISALGLASPKLPAFEPPFALPVKADTLVIYGQLDPRFSAATERSAMSRELASVSFTQALGHASPNELWGTAPDLLARTILQFIEGQPSQRDIAPAPLPPAGLRLASSAKLVVAGMSAFPILAAVLCWFLLRRLKKAMKRDLATITKRTA